MTLGGQSVTFVAVTETGDAGYLGLKSKARGETVVAGCQFWPTASAETPDGQTDVATGMWRCIAPAVAAVLAATPGDELKYDGVTYQIVGPIMPKRDMAGELSHVTVMCKRQVG